MLKGLCEHSWDSNRALSGYQRMPVPDRTAATGLLRASVRMKDWEFFERVVENTRGNFDVQFFNWAKEQITNGLSFAEARKP